MARGRGAYVLCLLILVCFFCSICVQAFTKSVLKDRLGMDNRLTSFLLFDGQELYTEETFLETVEAWATNRLVGYGRIVEAAKRYEGLIGWNFAPYSEENGIVTLSDGYLTTFIEERDVSEAAASVADFAAFCQSEGVDFLYAQAPYKICRVDDANLAGVVDFSNQNADELLRLLREAGVETWDIREEIHRRSLAHHSLYYRTDHHWRAETAFRASRWLLEQLAQRFGYEDVDPGRLDANRFYRVNYPGWFLGSQGRKLTLARTVPEDFSLIYPFEPTEFHYEIPNAGIDQVGGFSVTYHMEQLSEPDYYNKDPYLAYGYGNQPLIRIENKLLRSNRRVLLIHDSYGNPVSAFLAMALRYVDAIDPRGYGESLRDYIRETGPDTVIVLCNPGQITAPDWEGHWSMFDFR